MPDAMAMTFFSAPATSQPIDVGVRVDAEQVGWRSRRVQLAGDGVVAHGQHRGRRVAGQDLLGQVRAGEHAVGVAGQHLVDDLGHAQPAALLEALGEADHRHPGPQVLADLLERGAEAVGRHAHDHQVGLAPPPRPASRWPAGRGAGRSRPGSARSGGRRGCRRPPRDRGPTARSRCCGPAGARPSCPTIRPRSRRRRSSSRNPRLGPWPTAPSPCWCRSRPSPGQAAPGARARRPARAELARSMATNVVQRGGPAARLGGVRRRRGGGLGGRASGPRCIWRPGRGLNGAVTDGVDQLAALGYDQVIVAHADLPHALDLAWVADFDGVTLVPDRHDDGTNVACVPDRRRVRLRLRGRLVRPPPGRGRPPGPAAAGRARAAPRLGRRPARRPGHPRVAGRCDSAWP